MRGRRPKPREQRVMEGMAGHRPLPETVLVSGRPSRGEWDEPPAHLPEDARRFWGETVSRLVDVGLVDRVDVPLLEMLATQYARAHAARRVIAEVGYFTKGSRGQLTEHPAVRIEREATQLFSRLAEQFAIGAVSRSRLGLAELHARGLKAALEQSFGRPNLRPIDGAASDVGSGPAENEPI